MGVTIKRIAELAGTSKSTADRALKGRPGIKDEIRERVLEIAKRSQYKPNSIGKALRMQKSSMRIAVVFHWGVFEEQLRDGLLRAESEFYDYGVRLEFRDLKTRSFEEQNKMLVSLIDSGVSGVIIKLMRHPRIIKAVNALEDSGIPVVTISSDLPDSRRFCFIGQNYLQSGRVAGSLMDTALGGGGNVVIFQESMDFEAYTQREQGVTEVLRERGRKIRLRSCVCPGEGLPENYDFARAVVKKYPRTDGIVCTGISYPLIAQAVADAGRKDIKFIGFDIFADTVRLMEEGVVDFAISQDPFNEGYESVRILFQRQFNGTGKTVHIHNMPIGIHEWESMRPQ